MNKEIFLGVNIDHIATIRNARGTRYPDPLHAAFIAEAYGADGITLHLREDRRHIIDRDVLMLRESLNTPMNLEMAITREMLAFALKVKPEHVCLVPEKREELTTEGGLDVVKHFDRVLEVTKTLQEKNIEVSLFIEANKEQLDAAKAMGATTIELHTGTYADAKDQRKRLLELNQLEESAYYGHELGLTVNAGHGLHYHNVKPIAAIDVIHELNIGHAIIARALFCGLGPAVQEMKNLMREARG